VAPLSVVEDGRGEASKEKVFRKQRCLRNSSLKSASVTMTTDAASPGDGPGGVCAAELAESAPVLPSCQ